MSNVMVVVLLKPNEILIESLRVDETEFALYSSCFYVGGRQYLQKPHA